jgi:hypothetical protein
MGLFGRFRKPAAVSLSPDAKPNVIARVKSEVNAEVAADTEVLDVLSRIDG